MPFKQNWKLFKSERQENMDIIINDVAYDPLLFSAEGNELQRAKKVSEEVESLFVYQLLKEMDKTTMRDEDSIFNGRSEEIYRSLYYQELARELSRQQGIGIKTLVEDEINQQAQHKENNTRGIGVK